MEQPFRLLDPSGRDLVWVEINDIRAHSDQAFYNGPDCRIVICPRPENFGPQDIVSRPCFKGSREGFFRLRDEVHEWLVETFAGESRYQLEFRYAQGAKEPQWCVGFLPQDKDRAALFKLTWVNL
jgi:hypothetical protein